MPTFSQQSPTKTMNVMLPTASSRPSSQLATRSAAAPLAAAQLVLAAAVPASLHAGAAAVPLKSQSRPPSQPDILTRTNSKALVSPNNKSRPPSQPDILARTNSKALVSPNNKSRPPSQPINFTRSNSKAVVSLVENSGAPVQLLPRSLTPSYVVPEAVNPTPLRRQPQVLVLPVPSRQAGSSNSANVDYFSPTAEQAFLPQHPMPDIRVPAALPLQRPAHGARRGGLPARLQALDDQTVLPRDVYGRMMRLGDQARGALGYGQHRLTFAGPDGAPVLRHSDAPRT